MGIIIPKPSARTEEKTAFSSSVAVLTPPTPPVAGGPDAYLLSRSDFPHRDLPAVTGDRQSCYQIVFRQSVLDEIHAHGKSSLEAEVCGVLIGDIYSDRLACWGYVQHCIRGNDADGKQTQVTITSETWTRIHETLEKEYPGKKIIGWYHTHPGFGIFLSGMDLFIQDNFFNQPWQIATVYDPKSQEEGTFIWRGGKSERESILVEHDTATASRPTEAVLAIEELTRRVRHLERRLDLLLTGFLTLILLALTAPLIVFAIAPDAVKSVFRPRPLPAATAPSNPPEASTPANTGVH